MKILLISNRGRLQNAVEKEINNYELITIFINKELSLSELFKDIRKNLKDINPNIIIYISGETRDKDKMLLLNYIIPKEILRISQYRFIPLIYLSSLSVFGIPNEQIVTINSKRKSIDDYSLTKNLFDSYAKNNCVNASIVSIMPGSIINFSSKNDITNKLIKFSKSFPQKLILSKLHPKGNIACISIYDLSKCISREINNISCKNHKVFFKSEICTFNISITKILKYGFNTKIEYFLLPNIPFLNARIFNRIFNKINLKRLFLFFNKIEYVSNYDFLKEQNDEYFEI